MNLDLSNASVMAYSVEKKYLGEIFNYATAKKFTVRNIFTGDSPRSVYNTLTKYELLIANETANFLSININGTDFGEGRLLSISFDRNNPVRVGEFTAELEVYESGNLYNMAENYSDDYTAGYSGIKPTLEQYNLPLIENLQEDITSSIDAKNRLNVSHNVQIDFISGTNKDPIYDARAIASVMLDSERNYYPYVEPYKKAIRAEGVSTMSEDYDLINCSFSFSKSTVFYTPTGDTSGTPEGQLYGLNTTRSLSMGEDGVVSVTENGEVKLYGGEFKAFHGENSTGVFDLEIGSARKVDDSDYKWVQGSSYQRCNNQYLIHGYQTARIVGADFATYAGGLPSLNPYPAESSIQIESGARTASYSVTYTNDGTFHGTTYFLTHHKTESLSVEANGNVNITQDGTLTFLRQNQNFASGEADLTSSQSEALAQLAEFADLHASALYHSYKNKSDRPDPQGMDYSTKVPEILKVTSDRTKNPKTVEITYSFMLAGASVAGAVKTVTIPTFIKTDVTSSFTEWSTAFETAYPWLTLIFTNLGDELGNSVPSIKGSGIYNLPHAENIGDFRIGFAPKDGVGGTLASASHFHKEAKLGKIGNYEGDLIYDSSEGWRADGVIGTGQNVKTVGVHEIGHSLGFGHMQSNSSGIMFPYASSPTSFSDKYSLTSALEQDMIKGNYSSIDDIQLISSSITCPKYGKQFTYSKQYSNKLEYLDSVFPKLIINSNDNAPVVMKNNHIIPNHKEIIHGGFWTQTQIGTRSISLSAIVPRPEENIFSHPQDLKNYLDELMIATRDAAKAVSVDVNNLMIQDLFISSFDYTIQSNGTIQINAEVSYTAARTRTPHHMGPTITYDV